MVVKRVGSTIASMGHLFWISSFERGPATTQYVILHIGSYSNSLSRAVSGMPQSKTLLLHSAPAAVSGLSPIYITLQQPSLEVASAKNTMAKLAQSSTVITVLPTEVTPNQ